MYRRLLCRLLCAEYSRLCNLSTCCGWLQPRGGSLLSGTTWQGYFLTANRTGLSGTTCQRKTNCFYGNQIKSIAKKCAAILFLLLQGMPGATTCRCHVLLDKIIFVKSFNRLVKSHLTTQNSHIFMVIKKNITERYAVILFLPLQGMARGGSSPLLDGA